MAKKNVDHAERHPNVVLLCDNQADVVGAADIISSQVEAFRLFESEAEAVRVIRESKPGVILIALSSVEKAVALYTRLSKQDLLAYPHENILLCENRESGIAFRCCMKGLFNDYFVFKPMYENYRLKMILQNALVRTDAEKYNNQLREEHFGRIDDDLRQMIDEAAGYHQLSTQAIDRTRQELAGTQRRLASNAADSAEAKMMQALNDDHIVPLLSQLEQQLARGFNDMIGELESRQQALLQLAKQLNGQQVSAAARPKEPPGAVIPMPEQTEQAPAQKQPSLLNAPVPRQNKQPHILVAEDNDIYAALLNNVLTEGGYQVDCVSNGLAAIKKLKTHHYDMIFMDLFMPELDGLNTTKNIRASKGMRDIPIVALTCNKNKELVKRWVAMGLTGYITKPSSKHAILEAAERALLNKGTQGKTATN